MNAEIEAILAQDIALGKPDVPVAQWDHHRITTYDNLVAEIERLRRGLKDIHDRLGDDPFSPPDVEQIRELIRDIWKGRL